MGHGTEGAGAWKGSRQTRRPAVERGVTCAPVRNVLVLFMQHQLRLLPASPPARPRHRAFSCSVQSISREHLSAILSHFILV